MSLSKSETRLRAWLRYARPLEPEDPGEAESLASAAEGQGLAGLLAGAVAADPGSWPDLLRTRLREGLRRAAVRSLRQLELAARAQGLLADAGVRALPLKGAALAEDLYDTVGERPMSDVDLLVLDGWPAAVHALRGAGFREGERADHAWVFEDPAGAGPLELHHSVTSCPRFFATDGEGLWARSLPGAGLVRRRPAPEDLLIHLSMHAAFQHGLTLSLVQWLDIRRLLERTPPRVSLLLEGAREARAEGCLLASLEGALLLLGAPVPEGLLLSLQGLVARSTARWLQGRLADPDGLVSPAPPSFGRARWSLAAGRRAALLGGTLAPRLPGRREAPWRSGLRAVRRAGALFCHWGLPTLR